MPREIRKRGKKKSKAQEEDYKFNAQAAEPEPNQDVEQAPTWMRSVGSGAGPSNPLADIEAPFGYVDTDVKAYFRTVDLKLREWQEGADDEMLPEGVDVNEGMTSIPV